MLTHLGVIDIERIRAAPRDTAELRLAVGIANEPIGMLFQYARFAALDIERCKPYSREIALSVDGVGYGFHAVGEVPAVIVEPVADKRLIAVVYLEDIDAVMRPRKPF